VLLESVLGTSPYLFMTHLRRQLFIPIWISEWTALLHTKTHLTTVMACHTITSGFGLHSPRFPDSAPAVTENFTFPQALQGNDSTLVISALRLNAFDTMGASRTEQSICSILVFTGWPDVGRRGIGWAGNTRILVNLFGQETDNLLHQ
jgi:hypothetical protein